MRVVLNLDFSGVPRVLGALWRAQACNLLWRCRDGRRLSAAGESRAWLVMSGWRCHNHPLAVARHAASIVMATVDRPSSTAATVLRPTIEALCLRVLQA